MRHIGPILLAFAPDGNLYYNSQVPPQETQEITPPPAAEKGFFRETFEFVLIALVIALPIRFFIAQPFIVSGSSMVPTFENGDYLVIDQISYRFHEPARGDVIVFKYPLDPSKYFIKRIIGLPGETVEIHNNTLTIKNKESPNGFTLDEPYVKQISSEDFEKTLGNGEYFVMGDNRAASADSRIWGPLPAKDITGRAVARLFPLGAIAINPGEAFYTPQLQ
jgi:signal peptidase I